MAFRIRRKAGGTIWAGGSYRRPGGTVAVLKPGDVNFRRLATWRSPENGAAYPVKQRLVIRIDGRLASWILGAAVRRAGTDAVRDIVEFCLSGWLARAANAGLPEMNLKFWSVDQWQNSVYGMITTAGKSELIPLSDNCPQLRRSKFVD
jgi:hypothetical protein